MPNVMIMCPVTERRVPIGMEVEAGPRFRHGVPYSGTLRCGACGRFHAWYRAETVLEGVTDRRRRERPPVSTAPRIRYTLRQGDLAHR